MRFNFQFGVKILKYKFGAESSHHLVTPLDANMYLQTIIIIYIKFVSPAMTNDSWIIYSPLQKIVLFDTEIWKS